MFPKTHPSTFYPFEVLHERETTQRTPAHSPALLAIHTVVKALRLVPSGPAGSTPVQPRNSEDRPGDRFQSARFKRSTRLEPSSPDGGLPRTIPSSGKKRTWSRSMHPALKEILLWQETQTHLQRVVVSCAKCLGTDTCWTRQGWKGCQRTEMTQHKEQCTLCGRRGWWGWGSGGSEGPDRRGHRVGP